ncbi:MAG: hypothetical protein HPY50_03670 [Firmicutes bacterium]|nr:hypothetical protein [Bacillota bacterium]
MKTIAKTEIKKALETLNQQAVVWAPVKIDDTAQYAPLNEGGELALDWVSTRLSPKGALFPQTEKLYKFRTEQGELKVEAAPVNDKPQIIVGIRGCDVKAIAALDQVFYTKGYLDLNYQSLRENTTIVSLGCNEPLETCFCTSFGVNPQEAEGSDLVMYDLGDSYGFKPQTEKGEKVLSQISSLLQEKAAEPPKTKDLSLKVDLTGVTEKIQDLAMWDHPLWEKISQRCLGCGTCTYVCPFCHCFDIQGKTRGEKGFRYRCWDSCMYNDYTLMAGGHQPRPSQKERVRQRFMRKLRYFVERYGTYQCSGCGRCLQHCPVGIDIVEAIEKIKLAEAGKGE